jgi:hypothetical protein
MKVILNYLPLPTHDRGNKYAPALGEYQKYVTNCPSWQILFAATTKYCLISQKTECVILVSFSNLNVTEV